MLSPSTSFAFHFTTKMLAIRSFCSLALLLACLTLVSFVATTCAAQDRDAQNMKIALERQPIQKGVIVDSPDLSQAKNCTLEPSTKTFGARGFIVKDPAGQIVRLYQQLPNGTTHWTFFRNGNEVYREIDSNKDRRIDQYRWMGEAGTRWGLDQNQDGTIDSWQTISAEEVALEAFEAFKTGDQRRLTRLFLDNKDLVSLKLGSQMQDRVAKSVSAALKDIPALLKSQDSIQKESEFVNFGGSRPSSIPAGKMGLQLDLTIHDNAAALFSNADQISSLGLGTVVQVGNRWRLIEKPEIVAMNSGSSLGRFFMFESNAPKIVDTGDATVNEELAQLISQYSEIDQSLRDEKQAGRKAELFDKRTELMLEIAEQSEAKEDRNLWVRMCATEASVGYQTAEYEKGKRVLENLVESELSKDVRDFVTWELIQASTRDSRDGTAKEMAEANAKHMDSLADFVSQYPESENTAQALVQLAMFQEFSQDADSLDKAVEWYKTAARDFPESFEGKFAAGAQRRLESYGQPLALSGNTLNNRKLDTSAFGRKKIVVIHYWTTAEPLSLDLFEELTKLQSKYKDKVAIVGVNLDDDAQTAKNYLRTKQPDANWQHLWAEGGKQRSPHALEMGVITVPLTLLIDQQGEVVENQIIADQLDREVYRLLNRKQ